MAEAIYAGCAATSILCAVVLFRGYQRERVRLAFWTAICFIGFALSNILLFVDLVIIPQTDLSFWRILPTVGGVMALLFGFIWDSAN